MTQDEREIPPAELRALARERSQARRERRFADADRLRAEIEARGWNVVDRGSEARLVRAHPLDIVDADGGTRYGWSGAVPEATAGVAEVTGADPEATSAVPEVTGADPEATSAVPEVTGADPAALTIVLRAHPKAEATDSLIARLIHGASPGRHILVVAGETDADPTIDGADVIRTRGGVGPGTLLAVAVRRIADGVVVVGERWPADASAGDMDVLVARLADPAVAVVGLTGTSSDDLRQFSPGGGPDTPTEAVGWAGLAFRARDGRARGPVDEGFSDADLFAVWWSLVLRDEGAGVEPRSAIGIRSVPSTPSHDGPARDDRATKRDRYRIIDRFHGRPDLLTAGPAVR